MNHEFFSRVSFESVLMEREQAPWIPKSDYNTCYFTGNSSTSNIEKTSLSRLDTGSFIDF